MKQGDLVVRKSYGGDVIFKIQQLYASQAQLKGVQFRLAADSPIADLEPISSSHFLQQEQAMEAKAHETVRQLSELHRLRSEAGPMRQLAKRRDQYSYFEMPGKVLHLDGDPLYLRKCMALYRELRIPAEGLYVPEVNMAETVNRLLPQIRPDILVLTGHDGLLKPPVLSPHGHLIPETGSPATVYMNGQDMRSAPRPQRNVPPQPQAEREREAQLLWRNNHAHNLSHYKNSHHFVNAVKAARQFERNRDTLVIVAGACQSHFEALLQAGANYASSPGRVLIHALDPLYIAARIAYTSIKDTVHTLDVIQHTHSGLDGLGGIETRGCHRIGLPRLKMPAVGEAPLPIQAPSQMQMRAQG